MSVPRPYHRAFSVVEVLVVVAIISIIAAISYETFFETRRAQSLEKDSGRIVTAIERARSLTLSSSQDRQYGVHLESNRVTIFPGSTYNVSNPDNDIELLGSLARISGYSLAGGGSDVLFDRLTGETSQFGTITISLTNDASRFYTITILKTGLVEIN